MEDFLFMVKAPYLECLNIQPGEREEADVFPRHEKLVRLKQS